MGSSSWSIYLLVVSGQVADVFTKALTKEVFHRHQRHLMDTGIYMAILFLGFHQRGFTRSLLVPIASMMCFCYDMLYIYID